MEVRAGSSGDSVGNGIGGAIAEGLLEDVFESAGLALLLGAVERVQFRGVFVRVQLDVHVSPLCLLNKAKGLPRRTFPSIN